jgi:glycosyltransferase involved in cell wall biosynthesis
MHPLVDVNIAVYNHAPYLKQTLDSVLTQKTNFPFRLLIGDDFSTDGSREILMDYEKKFPAQVKVIYQEKNLGFTSADTNGQIIFRNSTAKYIAFLDGDDYWTDPDKLQKQVDFLENNPGYVACSSNVYEKVGDELQPMEVYKNEFAFNDLADGNSLYTSSVLFKNIIQLPDWYAECKMGDWIIWLLLTQNGLIYNFTEKMAVYRVHNRGIWISKGKEKNIKDMIAAYQILIRKLHPGFKKRLKQGAKQYYSQLLDMLAEKKSGEIFTWTARTFFKYYDIKQFRYLARYFRNVIKPGRALTSATNG